MGIITVTKLIVQEKLRTIMENIWSFEHN